MKTVKEVAEITGVSIRTLRYYDEIGLLKPTELTEAGYRLYDNKALEKLQEIMFFKELEVPLIDIKKIMDTPDYDMERAAVESLAENYKKMFALDNARNILINQFGAGCSEYVANAIKRYYGV